MRIKRGLYKPGAHGFLGPIHTGRGMRRTWQIPMQCGHPHSYEHVPFACIALRVASSVLCGLGLKKILQKHEIMGLWKRMGLVYFESSSMSCVTEILDPGLEWNAPAVAFHPSVTGFHRGVQEYV